MIDYALWEVIENGNTTPKTIVVEGVEKKLASQLKILGETLSQEDVNQKMLRSLSPEWNKHAVLWRNKPELETMSMDDIYNNLKVYEPEVKGTQAHKTWLLCPLTTLAALMKQLTLLMEFLLLAVKLVTLTLQMLIT
ncbi:hypothetical protein Tco_0260974 [Tanacetum coccineum]